MIAGRIIQYGRTVWKGEKDGVNAIGMSLGRNTCDITAWILKKNHHSTRIFSERNVHEIKCWSLKSKNRIQNGGLSSVILSDQKIYITGKVTRMLPSKASNVFQQQFRYPHKVSVRLLPQLRNCSAVSALVGGGEAELFDVRMAF